MSERFEKERKVYVVHGYWNTLDDDGVTIVKITPSEKKAVETLTRIIESKAKEYLEMSGCLQEEIIGSRQYEVTNGEKYAKFYITEEAVDCEE